MIIGHSWVRDLEYEHRQEDFGPNVEVVYASYPGIKLNGIKKKLKDHLDNTFTHVFVFILITEAFQKIDIGRGKNKLAYDVITADPSFDLHDFVHRFKEFVQEANQLCSGVNLWLMIPPYVDLNYYNQERVRSYPFFIKTQYYHDSRFEEKKLHGDSVMTYDKLNTLQDAEYYWPNRNLYPVVFAINKVTRYRNLSRQYLSGELVTLGCKGFLRDGLHPSKNLIHKLWSRMRIEARLTNEDIAPPAVWARTDTFMTLETEKEQTPEERKVTRTIYTTFGGTKVKTCYQNFPSKELINPPITTMAGLTKPPILETTTNTLGRLTNTSSPISIGRAPISITISEGCVDTTTTTSVGESSSVPNTSLGAVQSFQIGDLNNPVASTSGIVYQDSINPLNNQSNASNKRKLSEEFEIERDLERIVEKMVMYAIGFMAGKGHNLSEEEVRRKMKHYM